MSHNMRWPSESVRTCWRVQGFQSDQFVEQAHVLIERLLVDLVDFFQDLERFDHRQVPPQLGALSKDDAHHLRLVDAVGVGRPSVDQDRSAGRFEDAGHHLDRGRFTRAVGTDIADDFAAVDVVRDSVDSLDGAVIAGEQIAECAADPFAAVEDSKVFAEVLDVDQAHGWTLHPLKNTSTALGSNWTPALDAM